jgi:hypothetical protein
MQRHLAHVDIKDATLRLFIGSRKFYLSVDTTGSNQRRIQSVDSVRRHDDLGRDFRNWISVEFQRLDCLDPCILPY